MWFLQIKLYLSVIRQIHYIFVFSWGKDLFPLNLLQSLIPLSMMNTERFLVFFQTVGQAFSCFETNQVLPVNYTGIGGNQLEIWISWREKNGVWNTTLIFALFLFFSQVGFYLNIIDYFIINKRDELNKS